jgi:16S rRNA (cytidine1402-2'-O)-methyltransferase
MESILYIVSTPIGNLKDITLRALDILREVSFIACEDTRVTAFLLNNYQIKSDLVSLNAANESSKINYVLDRIKNGESCALVSDAGTPGISDPGARLISGAIRSGINVSTIPGASAAIAAITLSGFPTDSFIFEGFIPQKKGRQKILKELAEEKRTIIIYESTYRIEKLLNELNEYMPGRFIVVCRELTKKFEETWRGKPSDIIKNLPDKITKGEFTVVIAPLNWKLN